MKPQRQRFLTAALAVPLILGINGCKSYSGDDGLFDTAAYLKLACETTNPTPPTVTYQAELPKGKSIKVDDYTITSEGSGRIKTHIPDSSSHPQTFYSKGDEVYPNQGNIEFTVKSAPGKDETSSISVSRSCESK